MAGAAVVAGAAVAGSLVGAAASVGVAAAGVEAVCGRPRAPVRDTSRVSSGCLLPAAATTMPQKMNTPRTTAPSTMNQPRPERGLGWLSGGYVTRRSLVGPAPGGQ